MCLFARRGRTQIETNAGSFCEAGAFHAQSGRRPLDCTFCCMCVNFAAAVMPVLCSCILVLCRMCRLRAVVFCFSCTLRPQFRPVLPVLLQLQSCALPHVSSACSWVLFCLYFASSSACSWVLFRPYLALCSGNFSSFAGNAASCLSSTGWRSKTFTLKGLVT